MLFTLLYQDVTMALHMRVLCSEQIDWPCTKGWCSQSVQPAHAYLQLAMLEKYRTDSVYSLYMHDTCIHANYTRYAV